MNPLPEEPVLQVPIRVYFFDTDAGGVVHNVAYLRMLEVARSDLAGHLGWKLEDMVVPGALCPVVVRTEIDYLKPARMGDAVVIEARLCAMRRARFAIQFTIRSEDHGKVFCRARQILASLDLDTGKPRPLRQDWLARWPALLEAPLI